MSEWQPIETAPRDGSQILVYRPQAHLTNDPQVKVCRSVQHDKGCWEKTVPPGMDSTNFTDGYCKPTHWMPLPQPPKEQA